MTRLTHERACERLIYALARALDRYDYDAALALWSEDGVLCVPGRDHAGQGEIRRWMGQREKDMICRHIVTNVIVDVIDDVTAEATSYCSTWRVRGWRGREPGPMVPQAYAVEFIDSFQRKDDQGWLFARREVRVALAGVEQRQALRAT
ncbi:nuclear transport factor 2 family protein [Aquibium microcysteis]|uniref:nuclear transport factor 2 family protein n=1 Tax=Aquibium microcysteis TaxID=675281 RepID=UPI00165D17F5|nr:nuclear transport factor 2 family protein [Aquibium microcysteis]